jgi:hypothetical protein
MLNIQICLSLPGSPLYLLTFLSLSHLRPLSQSLLTVLPLSCPLTFPRNTGVWLPQTKFMCLEPLHWQLVTGNSQSLSHLHFTPAFLSLLSVFFPTHPMSLPPSTQFMGSDIAFLLMTSVSSCPLGSHRSPVLLADFAHPSFSLYMGPDKRCLASVLGDPVRWPVSWCSMQDKDFDSHLIFRRRKAISI